MTELDRIIDARRKRIGLEPNTGGKGFFRSVKDNFLTSSVSALGGMGKTGEEVFGFGSGLREWSEDTLRTNRQWQPSSDDGIGAYVGGAIGSAAGSTAVIAPALAADALFGTKGALSFGLVFSQTYGENLQRNRAAYGPDAEEKSRGLAAAESAVDAFTEVALGTIPMVGKALKGLSYGGKRQLVQAMFREAERDLGRSGAKRFFLGMAKNGAEEAGEEGIQYVNSWLWRAVGGDKQNEFHTEEMADAMAQGFIGGAALASPFALHDARMRQSPQENRADVNDTGARLTAEVARDLGLNVRFFDEEGAPSATDGKGHRVNGWHDPETNEIWIDRTSPGANPLETLGHEFKHYLDQRGLTEQFDKLFREGMNEAGKQVLSETEAEQAEAGYAGRGENEFSADTFGSMWTKPEFWQDVTGRANKMDAGFTQQLLDALQDFIRMIQRKLKGIGTPEAKELFDNMKELKAEAARLTAEARAEAAGVSRSEDRSKASARPGDAVEPQRGVGEQRLEGAGATETGSVESAPLSDGVQRIAVKDLHIDPARFQFKSKADKITGVDESNKVGGEFDPKTAGNLYVWEDKTGKKFVVNGHHRLELARRNKVDAVNAIVEREADGISAEQARRNGVLINIRDEQGDVRDYAEFVRSEKMDDATAEKEGILAREKGRRGYLIGRYASENLYHRFRDGDLSEVRAATIADVARGDEAIEAAGIKAKAMPRLQLQEYLKFLKETPREKSETGDLFGFDDSAMREGEALSKIASQHIRDLQERLRSVKGALASPERAAKGDVKVGKRAKKIFKKTEEELRRWENWPTDAELRQEMLSRSEDRSKASAPAEHPEGAVEPQSGVGEQSAEDAGEREANVQAKQKLVQGTLNWENGKRYSIIGKTGAGRGREAEARMSDLRIAREMETTGKDAKTIKRATGWERGGDGKWRMEIPDLKIKREETLPDGTTYEKSESDLAWHDGPLGDYVDAPELFEAYPELRNIRLAVRPEEMGDVGFSYGYFDKSGNTIAAYSDVKYLEGILAHEIQHAIQAKEGFPEGGNPDKDGKNYWRLAGEVEARNAEKRRRMTEEEKRNSLLEETADVAEEDKIYLTRADGMEHSFTEGAVASETKGKNIRRYLEYLAQREQNGVLKLNDIQRELLKQFYESFPLGEKIQNRFGEEIEFSPMDPNGVDDYIQHFAVKRARNTEHFSMSHLTLFKQLVDSLKNPDERILTENGNGERRICFLKRIEENGNHYIVTAIAENGRLLAWTHMDSPINYIRKQRENEKQCVEKYGLVDKNGKAVNVSYEGYLKLKSDMPLFLATAQGSRDSLSQVSNRASKSTISPETEKSSGVEKKSDVSDKADGRSYSLRRQVNPIIEDGEIRREYQDSLNDRDYTPERIAEWDKTAIEWIERQGGIQNAAELIANSTEHNDRHVATLVRRHVMNSEVFRELSPEVREEVEYQNLKEGTSWGREGAARRLAAMTLDSIERVRALFRRLHENMPDAEAQKLRNRVMDSTGVDVYNLPEDIVNDKAKLDEVLRAELASKSKWHDKAYEYWINAILSGPATHSVNVMGNTANGLYELGVKRFTEAALNTVFRRKDGATFGEFKEMWKAFDVKRAWGKALEAFNLETLTPAGKFRENQAVAIPGEVGRVVRLPGRLLTMADAFARELLIPVEASAQAYRAGKAQGLKGDALRKYIEAEIANPGSKAYQAGKASAERVIFQEEPGALVRQLVAMREGDGIGAQILKFTLPFIKTPANVLRQAVRKSPLGSVSLGIETGKLLLGKRKFDGDYIGRVAEQLLAWGAFLALGGLGDNDEPRITGSSAAYGSAEQKYKANRIPPYSIRIGDTWYSYQRLDPFATGLALIADASQALRNGAEATGALKKMIQGTGKMLSEKSYLDSINQIYQFMENPEKSAMDFGTNFLSSWVPNVMRQASYAVDDYQRDYKSAGEGLEFLRDQMHVVTSKAGITRRVPKVDLWGREITKEEAEKVGNAADTVWRFLIPVKRVGVETDNPGERLIENWNARHPDEAWWGSLPNRKVTVNGERVELSGEEYHDYAVKAGRMAYKQMMNAVRRGLLHPENPTEADIKLLKQIFRRARRTVKVSP